MTGLRQHERAAGIEGAETRVGASAGAGASARTGTRGDRRCIVNGGSTAPENMIRFVVAPDGAVVPDLAEKLPGRGLWVTASREALATAARKQAFSRAARRKVTVREDLIEAVEDMLAVSVRSLLGLTRRAGQAIAGHTRVEDALRRGRVALLLEASDGAVDACARLRRLGAGVPVQNVLTRGELGLAFDREQTVHAAILVPGKAPGGASGGGRSAGGNPAGLTVRLTREFTRLAGIRGDNMRPGLENSGEGCIETPRPGITTEKTRDRE